MIIPCSHLQYLPHGCHIHSPHVMTLTHANGVKTRHPIIQSSCYLPSSILTFHLKLTIIHMVLTSFHTSYPIYLKTLHPVTIMFLFSILSPHLNLTTIHMVPTRSSKHRLILPYHPLVPIRSEE